VDISEIERTKGSNGKSGSDVEQQTANGKPSALNDDDMELYEEESSSSESGEWEITELEKTKRKREKEEEKKNGERKRCDDSKEDRKWANDNCQEKRGEKKRDGPNAGKR
jgi:hypothetical protein